jgi:GH15 family glucan-1,4-alpha-glucosidase
LPTDGDWDSDLMLALLEHLESAWEQPDEGIWEVRGPRRQFTHSKVMAWVAFDRAIALARDLHILPMEKVARWTEIRDRIHDDVCEKGFDTELNSFTQYYGSKLLDASLLMLAIVGFLPPDDPRIVGTVAAIQDGLVEDGFVRRYQTETNDVDGLPGGEGAFLMTTFWLADNLVLMGRRDEADAIFDRVCALQNDVGLLSEEFDPATGRMLGNFPQAFSHVALINTAANLSMDEQGPSAHRRRHGTQS